jgi:hypothetical protein
MADPGDTEKLRQAQRQREQAEEELAERAADEDEALQHERRAEKARYLREKLDERARTERDTG